MQITRSHIGKARQGMILFSRYCGKDKPTGPENRLAAAKGLERGGGGGVGGVGGTGMGYKGHEGILGVTRRYICVKTQNWTLKKGEFDCM